MKKLLSFALTLSLLFGCLSLGACQSSSDKQRKDEPIGYITVGDYLKKLTDTQKEIFEPYGFDSGAYVCCVRSAEVAIPSEHDGKPIIGVVGTGGEGNFDMDALEYPALTIPEGVRFIGDYCCVGEKELSLPSTLELVYNSSLYRGDGTITFPEGVKEISYSYDHTNSPRELKSVVLPDSLQTVRNSFSGCTALGSTELPENLTEITESFSGLEMNGTLTVKGIAVNVTRSFSKVNLKELIFASEVASIDDSFAGKGGKIEKLVFSGSVESIANTAFDDIEIDSMTVEGIVGTISDSFNYGRVYEVLFRNAVDRIDRSFNLPEHQTSELVPTFAGSVNSIGESFNNRTGNVYFRDRVNSVIASFQGSGNDKRIVQCDEGKPAVMEDSFEDVNSLFTPDSEMYAKADFADASGTPEKVKARALYEAAEPIKNNALKKLADSGAIPPLDENGYPQFDEVSNNGIRCDQITFNSESERIRLTTKPDFTLDHVIILEKGAAFKLDGVDESKFVDSLDDCKYIVYQWDYVSVVRKNYFIRKPDNVLVDRHDITTVVFVIDAKTGEIIHLHSVATRIPHLAVETLGDEEGAWKYIAELLNR